MKNKVYIASPYTKGDVAVNVKAQMDVADELMDRGYIPFVPLLSHFLHMANPRPYKDWLEMDLEILPLVDAVLRLPGESVGADAECALAHRLGIPVVTSYAELEKI